MRFSNTNPAPDTETRDITVVVNDGTDPSNTAHATILLNNPPTVPVDNDADRRRRHRRCGGRHRGRHRRQLHRSGSDRPSTYSFATDRDAGGRFKIDSSTGVVSVSAAGATGIDFEGSGGSYASPCRATDAAGAFSEPELQHHGE